MQCSEHCTDYEDCTTAILDSDCFMDVGDRSVGMCGVAACGDVRREGSSYVLSLARESPEFLYMGADESHSHLIHCSEASWSEWE